ncbi:hypothetical protein AB5I41_06940 [Sphingomonas sp. MMS24-JH45]
MPTSARWQLEPDRGVQLHQERDRRAAQQPRPAGADPRPRPVRPRRGAALRARAAAHEAGAGDDGKIAGVGVAARTTGWATVISATTAPASPNQLSLTALGPDDQVTPKWITDVSLSYELSGVQLTIGARTTCSTSTPIVAPSARARAAAIRRPSSSCRTATSRRSGSTAASSMRAVRSISDRTRDGGNGKGASRPPFVVSGGGAASARSVRFRRAIEHPRDRGVLEQGSSLSS